MLFAAMTCNAKISNHNIMLEKFGEAIYHCAQDALIEKIDTTIAIASLPCNPEDVFKYFYHKIVLDKFDNPIEESAQRILIEKYDTLFWITEERDRRVGYIIIDRYELGCEGDKDNIVYLAQDVYGYEECWCAVLANEYSEYLNEKSKCTLETNHEKRASLISKLFDKYVHFITHRVITTPYSHQFIKDFFWVQKGNNKGKTIYSKPY